MPEKRIENLNILAEEEIISPTELRKQYPLTEKVIQTVLEGQTTIKNILNGQDKRLFVIVGPCSIHDVDAAKEYAEKLVAFAKEVPQLYIVMRVYFEKPRTNVGWQGLINDPYLDDSCKIEEGLKLARGLLLHCGEIGLPAATEALGQISPQYIQDLISWTAIGARTTESQNHRKMASGFTSAVGFKNSTNGDIHNAINAMRSASSKHNFISVNPEGRVAIIRTKGNANTHIILRGGIKPNYDAQSVKECEEKMKETGFTPKIVIDCSHGNSQKDHRNQAQVLHNIAQQMVGGNQSIKGIMLESNLFEGKQSLQSIKTLKYGVSITDACIGWDETKNILHELNNKLKLRK